MKLFHINVIDMGKLHKSIRLPENYFSNKTRRSQRRPNFLAPSFRQQLTRKLSTRKRVPVYGQSVYTQVERETVRRPKFKSRHPTKRKRQSVRPDLILYEDLYTISEKLYKFSTILLTSRRDLYDEFAGRISTINDKLFKILNDSRHMYPHYLKLKQLPPNPFEGLLDVSSMIENFATKLSKRRKYTFILDPMTKQVNAVYLILISDLDSFEYSLGGNKNNKNANKGHASKDDGLGELLNSFKGLGLGK